jgi:hypothetical protein
MHAPLDNRHVILVLIGSTFGSLKNAHWVKIPPHEGKEYRKHVGAIENSMNTEFPAGIVILTFGTAEHLQSQSGTP